MVASWGAAWLVGAATAAVLAVALALPSCGVTSQGDCVDKATCAAPDVTAGGDEEAAAIGSDDSSDLNAEAGAQDAETEAADEDHALDECVPVGPEDCTNGIDDDCNGFTDCADPACNSKFRCAFSPGGGWLGPIAFWEGSPEAGAPPPCPPGYDTPMDWTGNLDAPPLTCSCSCAASGEQCVSTIGTVGGDMACRLPCAVQAVTTGCTALMDGGANCGNNFSFNADPPAPTRGTCIPTVRKSTPIKPAWTIAARTCTVVGVDKPGGCNGGNAQCLLTPAAPYGSATCVYQIVTNGGPLPSTCPDGFAPKPKLLYSPSPVITDTRDCSPCTCRGPDGGSCGGTIAIFGGTTCAGPAATYTLGSGCTKEMIANNPTPSHLMGSYALTPGTCGVAVDTSPSGAAASSGGTTVVCCM
ncbi:MAG: hypothetical protein M3O36_21600 [Myxococcota bacterium]|nr:hypothetical protein [Myxococcota bacterium]